MIVVSISSAAGHSTSRSTTSSGSRLAKSKVSPPIVGRAIGTLERRPPRWLAVTFGVGPWRNQVTMRVASVASVGAMSSPTSALTSVDLPALSVPASAMRIGWLSRRPIRSSSLCTSGRCAVRRVGPVGLDRCRQGSRAPDRSCSWRAQLQLAVGPAVLATPSISGRGLRTGVGARELDRVLGDLAQDVELTLEFLDPGVALVLLQLGRRERRLQRFVERAGGLVGDARGSGRAAGAGCP